MVNFSEMSLEQKLESVVDLWVNLAQSAVRQVDGTTTSGQSLVSPFGHQAPQFIVDHLGNLIRTDLVLFRSPEKTIRLHHWTGYGDMSRPPHDHPWEFTSYILKGAYTEVLTTREGVVTERTLSAGQKNHCPAGTFHQVKDPVPGTVSLMVTGQASPGNAWGYLDGGGFVPALEHPVSQGFLDVFKKANWHLPLMK